MYKKTILAAALVLAGLVLSLPGAKAQPYFDVPGGVFNHWAAGFSAGTDGIGLTVGTAAFRRVEVRGGFSWFPGVKATQMVKVGIDEPWSFHGRSGFTSRWGSLHGHLMLDIYPESAGEFRFTVGLVAGGGEGYYHRCLADPLPATDVPFEKRAWSLPSGASVTADHDGYLRFTVDRPRYRPYVGVGMGHCISNTRRRQVGLDAGLMYVGRRGVYGYDYSGGEPRKVALAPEDIDEVESKFFDFTAHLVPRAGLFSILSRCPVQPVVKVTVTYRLF